MPIVMAPVNQEVRIVKIIADEKTKKHLENLGITINSSVTVLSVQSSGVILKVKDGRLALDASLSRKIFIA